MKKELIELVKIARELGSAENVQGSGGNLSVKTDGQTMLIKASGLNFKDLNAEGGFVALEYPKLAERYGNIAEPERADGEKKEADFLLSCRLHGESGRPSMEAGFHAFLGKYVLHTHSAYANVLTCARGGKELADNVCAKIGEPHAFLEYFHPGAELAIAVGRLAGEEGRAPKIIFLKNHGLVISASSAGELFGLYKNVNEKIIKTCGLEQFLPIYAGLAKAKFSGASFAENILFPDQAIFEGGGVFADSAATQDLFSAWSYVLSSINYLGLRPEFLPAGKISYLKQMDAEKYRKTILA